MYYLLCDGPARDKRNRLYLGALQQLRAPRARLNPLCNPHHGQQDVALGIKNPNAPDVAPQLASCARLPDTFASPGIWPPWLMGLLESTGACWGTAKPPALSIGLG